MPKFDRWLIDQGLTRDSLSKNDIKELEAEYEADMKIIAELPKEIQFEVEGKIECSMPTEEEEGKLPTFKIVAYTGKPIKQPFGEVIVDIEGMDISKQIPILWHHDSKLPVGHSTKIEKVEGTGVVIEGVVSGDPSDPVVAKFLTMSKNGFPFQASIGAPIRRAKRVTAGQTETVNGYEVKGGMIVALNTELVETSVLPIGADRNTNTKVSAQGGNGFENPKLKRTKKMNEFDKWLIAKGFSESKDLDESIVASLETMYKQEKEALESKDNEDGKIANLEAELAELKRVDAIKAEGGEHAEIVATAIENKWSVEQVKSTVAEINKIQAGRPAPAVQIKGDVSITDGAIEASIGSAMGLSEEVISKDLKAEDVDASKSLNDVGFLRASEMLLQANGQYRVGMSHLEMLQLAFSTTSLPIIMNNVANKALMAEYSAKQSNIMEVAERVTAKDFKQITWANIFKDLVLKPVGQHGEMEHGTTSETSYPMSVEQYARKFSVGRKDLINDDLDALRRVFAGYGRGASVAEQRDFWGTFLNDGGSFYDAGNSNLINPVLSIDGLTEAFNTIWAQTDENGDPIQLTGAKLVVPPSLSIYANQLAKETTVNETTSANKPKPASNPHAGKFSVVTESYLDNGNVAGGSSTAWYLVANQKDVVSFASLRLQGQTEPTIRQGQIGIGGLGVESDALFDFGSATVDPIGVVKSTGTV